GLWNGMISVWNHVTQWLQNAASSIGGIFSKVLKFGSPSKVMYQLGVWTTQGFHQGFKGEFEGVFLPYVTKAMQKVQSAVGVGLNAKASIALGTSQTSQATNTAINALWRRSPR